MTPYEPISIAVFKGRYSERTRQQEVIFQNCSSMEFYLSRLLRAYDEHRDSEASKVVTEWERSAPRPIQRCEALRVADEGESSNLILFGCESGTGKTSVAMEAIWRDVAKDDGTIHKPDYADPVAISGHEFARRVSCESLSLDALLKEFLTADILLLDDLDKRGDKDGKFSSAVQQAIFEVIEKRTTRDVRTIITMNSNGAGLLKKFGDDIGPYLLRRLRERFRAINFDPQLSASNIIPIQQTA